MTEIIKQKVSPEDNDIRLDRWFKRHYPQYSFSVVAKLTRKGQVRVDGKRTEASERLQQEQEVRFPLIIPNRDKKWIPERYKELSNEIINDLIYKDENVLIINKPQGLATQGGSKINISVDALAEFWKFGLEHKPKLVHRLDKDTSGILVLARDYKAAHQMSKIFQNREARKKYLAVLQGVPKQLSGTINVPLEKKEWDKNFESVKISQSGKKSLTQYQVLDYTDKIASLVELELITGRTHQLRAHCSTMGWPILGDKKYGGSDMDKYRVDDFLYLHSSNIEFELFGKKISAKAPLPRHFINTLKHLGLSNKCKI